MGLDLRVFRGSHSNSSEDSVQRSLGDALFQDLELDLESLELLQDISSVLAESSSQAPLPEDVNPGRILRITAPGTLFHPSQLSEALVGMATAAHGLDALSDTGDAGGSAPPVPPSAKSNAQRKAERASRQVPGDPRYPEDHLPSGEQIPVMGVRRTLFSGIIRLIRGVFGEGMHLHLRPAGVDGPIISARLEEGRRFLDSSPEVLFSRYGLAEQDWTVVGVVGQLGSGHATQKIEDVTNEDGSVNRAKLVAVVGQLLEQASGLVDLPRGQGFSIVPLAVYRAISPVLEAERGSAD